MIRGYSGSSAWGSLPVELEEDHVVPGRDKTQGISMQCAQSTELSLQLKYSHLCFIRDLQS